MIVLAIFKRFYFGMVTLQSSEANRNVDKSFSDFKRISRLPVHPDHYLGGNEHMDMKFNYD